MKKSEKERVKQFFIGLLAAVLSVGVFVCFLYVCLDVKSHPIEIVAVMANVFGMSLVRKQNILGWGGFVISVVLIGIFSIWNGIPGTAIMQFGFFVPTSVYAIYVWLKKKDGLKKPVWMTRRQRGVSFLLFITVFAFMFFVTSHATILLHACDTTVVSLLITGQVFLIMKKKESWLFLIPGNALSAGLFFLVDGYLIMALSLFNAVNAAIGFIQWKRK